MTKLLCTLLMAAMFTVSFPAYAAPTNAVIIENLLARLAELRAMLLELRGDVRELSGAAGDVFTKDLPKSLEPTQTRISLNNKGEVIVSDPATTTHTLVSKGGQLGISKYGGGYVNQIVLPNSTIDVSGPASDRYGRGTQSSVRDWYHSGAYNPTQAGFTDVAGALVTVTRKGNALIVPPQRAPLFCGGGKFDYVQNTDIDSDRCNKTPNRQVDEDNIPEGRLTQIDEIVSEFDYSGSYRVCQDMDPSIAIPCFQHYFRYDYVRAPGHVMEQFGPQTRLATTAPYTIEQGVVAKSSDLADMDVTYSMRIDNLLWEPQWRFVYDTKVRAWEVYDRLGKKSGFRADVGTYAPLIIIGTDRDAKKGTALGIYRPADSINKNPNLVASDDGKIQMAKNRDSVIQILENSERTGEGSEGDRGMQLFGFRATNGGLQSRDRLPRGQYEAYQNNYYILMGTPEQILQAAQKIQSF